MNPKLLLKGAAVAATSLAMVATGAMAANADPGQHQTAHASMASGQATSTNQARAAAHSPKLGTVRMQRKSQVVVLKLPAAASFSSVDVYKGSKKKASGVYAATGTCSNGKPCVQLTLKSKWGRGWFSLQHPNGAAGTVGFFKVKSGIDGSLKHHNVIRMKHRGSRLHFKVGLRYFAPKGWKKYKHAHVRIQQKSGKHWKTVKKMKLNKKGKGSWTRHIRKGHTYRLAIKSKSKIAGGHSTSSYV